MGLKVLKLFSAPGVSSQLHVKAGDAFRYTVDVSNDFDGQLFLRFTENGQSYEVTPIAADATNVVVEVSRTGIYDFKVEFSEAQKLEMVPALTGTAEVKLFIEDKILHEIKDFSNQPKFQFSEGGLRIVGSQVLDGSGVRATDYISVVEKGNEVVRQTVLTLANQPVTVANTSGASFGSAKLYDFPAGRILVHGVTANLSIVWTGQDIAADGSGDLSLGTTATSDATLSTTDVNLLPSTAMTDPFVLGVGAASGALAASAQFDGTSTAIDMYLNMIIDDVDVADAASDIVLVSGSITVTWTNLGDY